MAKDKITDYSATNASNADIGGVGIQGTNSISNLDNAIREFMTHLAETNAGTYPVADTWTFGDPADLTKRVRIDAGNVTAGQTRVLSMPDGNVMLVAGTMVASGTILPNTPASSSGAASIAFAEDTDNGSHVINLKAPASVTGDADVVLPDGAGTLARLSDVTGVAEDPIPAEDFVPPLTNGAQAGIRILTSNGQSLFYYAFDTSTQEILYAKWLPKKRYDGGTITFAPIWTAESGSGTVEFELSAVACSNDDPLDAAFGTAQASADTLTTAGDNHTGPTSSVITIAGTFADGDFVWLKLVRDVANDTLGVDAQFLGLKIFYTTDQANDA